MTKELRAVAILPAILDLAAEGDLGKAVPADEVTTGARLIEKAPWRVRLTPDHRISLGRMSETRIVSMIKPELGCLLLEVEMFGDMALQANVRGEEAQIHLYKPGNWEARFGVDCQGDSVPVTPFIYAHPKNPAWHAFIQSPDYQWLPRPDAFAS